jgi:hypothetical protein
MALQPFVITHCVIIIRPLRGDYPPTVLAPDKIPPHPLDRKRDVPEILEITA